MSMLTEKVVYQHKVKAKARDMDKIVRGQKVKQNTFDKMGRRLPDALGY